MGISIWQIVLVLVIILILFGAGKFLELWEMLQKGSKALRLG